MALLRILKAHNFRGVRNHTAHLCQVIAYDLLLMIYDHVYIVIVLDGCKIVYFISLIFLNDQLEMADISK